MKENLPLTIKSGNKDHACGDNDTLGVRLVKYAGIYGGDGDRR